MLRCQNISQDPVCDSILKMAFIPSMNQFVLSDVTSRFISADSQDNLIGAHLPVVGDVERFFNGVESFVDSLKVGGQAT